jgi:hypothetical protein
MSNAARQARDAWVLQGNRRTKHGHHAVAGELIHRAAIASDRHRRPVEQIGHDLAQPLGTHLGGNIHRMNNIGENHRHLLELGPPVVGGEGRTTAVAEPRIRPRVGATRSARRNARRCGTSAHVNMVSPRRPCCAGITAASVRKMPANGGVLPCRHAHSRE